MNVFRGPWDAHFAIFPQLVLALGALSSVKPDPAYEDGFISMLTQTTLANNKTSAAFDFENINSRGQGVSTTWQGTKHGWWVPRVQPQ